jgi:hypothetical protein
MKAYVAGVLGAVGCWVVAGAGSAASLEEIQACLASNIPKTSSSLTVTLHSRHRDGGESRHEGSIRWRRSAEGRSETLICMAYPPAVRGLAYLILGSDSGVNLWGYLPEKQRVAQIHARGAARRARIARTAIGYDDLRYLPMNLSRAEPREPRDSQMGERRVAVVDLSLPPGEDPVYERIVSFVDPESCVPLRTEFYDTADRLLKVATADPGSIHREGKIHVAHSLSLEDLKNEVRTELRIEQVQVDLDLPDDIFVPNHLRRNLCR